MYDLRLRLLFTFRSTLFHFVGILRVLTVGWPVPPHQLSYQLKYTLTVYQRPSRLRDYLACTHANTSTLSTVGQPLIQGNHKLHVIEVPFRLRAAHSEAKHCIFYITYIHMCVFGGGDIHAIFQTFVYTLSFLVPQLSYRGSTFYYPSTSETQLWLSILCLLNLPY